MGANDGGESPGNGREEKIFVSVRLRPLNGKEVARNDVSDWECVSDNTIIYKNTNISVSERSMYPSAYTFDRVFSCDCSTRQVYKEAAKEVALSVVGGINSSIFAYGQTSSGKTYTMTGITEYTLADIFDYIQKHTEREFLLKFSAMEIYNESVRDLLSSDTSPLRLLDDPERGTVVEKLIEETVRDWDHILELLSICEAQRQSGETSLNEASSRSHQIIRLTIESSAREFLSKGNSSVLVAAVNFVDLAGSERASQSLTAGTRLKEGCHINRSLLTLGTVIRKLSKGRTGHIPFRDSKLTRILQSSLGGNARTAIICTMSPARTHVEQSRNTLLFASCAKEVCTNAQVNLVMTDKALVKHLQRELVRMESELKAPGSTYMTSHCAALLREKDLQIEKLEKEIKDLILQRDIAQAQVQDLLRVVGDQENSLTRLGSGDYPHLRVRRSPDCEILSPETAIPADPRSFEDSPNTFGSTRYSNANSDSSCDDNYIQISELQEAFMQNSPSPRLLISTSQLTLSDTCSGWEDVEERSNGTSEDLCKEVRCIETELSTNRYIRVQPRVLLPKENMALSGLAVLVDIDSSYPDSMSPRLKDGGELVSPNSKEDGEVVKISLEEAREEVDSPIKEDTEIGLKSSLEEAREEVGSPMKGDTEIGLKSSLEEAWEEVGSPMKEVTEIGLKSSLEEDREEVGSPMKEDTEMGLKSLLEEAREEAGSPVKEDTEIEENSSFEDALEEAIEEEEPPMKEDREILSTPYIEGEELSCIDQPVVTSPEKPFPWGDLSENILSSSRSLNLQKSRSCKASLLISIPSMLSEKFEKDENTPPNGSEKEFTGRPRSLPGKISTLNYNIDLQTLPKKCSCMSVGVVANVKPDIQKNSSADEDVTNVTTCTAETKERAETDVDKQVADTTEKETEAKLHEPIKAVKDVGLDPIEDYFRSPSSWSLEFKKLQREIIDLWDACNVSLVHRTYFFMLFKGDPTDSIYMEVELRRLSFLKSSFARGHTNHTVDDVRTPTPASSMKALRREREVLSKQMQKKLSEHERESLFLRWGISLSSKYRRYQLACRIWTKTDDMEHIADSAVVVAKVVGINELGQAPKEMFGFSFPPRPSKRSYSFKRSLIPLL